MEDKLLELLFEQGLVSSSLLDSRTCFLFAPTRGNEPVEHRGKER